MDGFADQTKVFFRKISRIAIKEKFWKFIIFAALISFLVCNVIGGKNEDGQFIKMFETYDDTKSGFFTIVSASIWIGIFNSIQSICKAHQIIRDEYRNGSMLSAYVTAHAIWQFIICLAQSVILMVISGFYIDYAGPEGSERYGIFINTPVIEYFVTIFLLMYGSDLMGLMISSISDTTNTAMTIMPFVLILQLVMSGVLYKLDGVNEIISNITFSKWGMNAFGSIADLNDVKRFPFVLSMLHPDLMRNAELDAESCFDHTAGNLIIAWAWCIGLALLCYFISIISLKLKNRNS